MSAGSNIQGAGGQTLEQRIANIEAALRGGPPVIDAMGVPTDGDVDIGSALNAWRDVFANGLVVGGARVDIAALAGSAAVYVFDASDATFSLARHSNRCPNSPVVRSQRWRRRRSAVHIQSSRYLSS